MDKSNNMNKMNNIENPEDGSNIVGFTYTARSVKKAQKRRYLYESKWRWLHITRRILLALFFIVPAIVYFLMLYYFNTHQDHAWTFAFVCAGSIGFWVIILNCIKTKLTISGMFSDFDEMIFIENEQLYQVYRTSAGYGALSFVPSSEIHEIKIPLKSIHDLRYDPRSGRIEFLCTAYHTIYEDWENKISQGPTEVYENIEQFFYDIYEPNLLDYLAEQGIPYTEETIEYVYMKGVQSEREKTVFLMPQREGAKYLRDKYLKTWAKMMVLLFVIVIGYALFIVTTDNINEFAAEKFVGEFLQNLQQDDYEAMAKMLELDEKYSMTSEDVQSYIEKLEMDTKDFSYQTISAHKDGKMWEATIYKKEGIYTFQCIKTDEGWKIISLEYEPD